MTAVWIVLGCLAAVGVVVLALRQYADFAGPMWGINQKPRDETETPR